MSPHSETKKLLVWSDDIEPEALAQAERASRLPFVAGHVALMPDAHFGKGACVGSVIPTAGAIIPAAVGVDIGCGMVAVQTHQSAADLPDSLDALMSLTEARIPAGLGEGHDHRSDAALAWFGAHDRTDFDAKQERTTVSQFGTLGSGNHFVEVCTDKADGDAVEADRINCHHNYTAMEHHGRDLWITRKGAIKAAPHDRGVIPGSMERAPTSCAVSEVRRRTTRVHTEPAVECRGARHARR